MKYVLSPKMKIIRCSPECLPVCPWFLPCCSGMVGPAGPAGPAGEAATIEIGTVTTGAPGTPAEVTNSGTSQHAILNFVIPQGEPGGTVSPQFLNAYSTPFQPNTSGDPLIFDRNGTSAGTAVTHTENTSDITIEQPGYYSVSFHATVTPGIGATFPLSVLYYLQQNGNPVAGTGTRHTFQNASEVANLSFTQIVEVDTVPTTLNVISEGGPTFYSDASITVNQIAPL